MEDELEQEGMEEEISPAKSGGGGMMKKLIIGVVLLVVAAGLAYTAMIMFFPSDPADESAEEQQSEPLPSKYDLEYQTEHIIDPAITISLHHERRIRNLVVDATFMTSSGGVAELTKRDGLVRTVIKEQILSLPFPEYVGSTVFEDSLKGLIEKELMLYLPESVEALKVVYINIVTQ